jgi:hypothetical protein
LSVPPQLKPIRVMRVIAYAAARYRQEAVYGAIEAELELAAAPTEPASPARQPLSA